MYPFSKRIIYTLIREQIYNRYETGANCHMDYVMPGSARGWAKACCMDEHTC